MHLSVFLLGLIQYGNLSAPWTCVTASFPILGKFLHYVFKHFPKLFSSYSSRTPIMQMLVHFYIVQEVFLTVLVSFYF